MHKSKKKSNVKAMKIPKPIKIKKEKTEEDRMPHPMSHYIDDRLELVKQIFGSLKPKTITNLAPEFLKKKTLEEIEELCLNELLGISTKRLKSVINATKCPTDTESSEDSDVHNIEEHISLEEISSDSEIEGNSSNATKKKISGSTGGPKKSSKNGAEKNETDGQISVLELLELQARARAIRSQLALEPVTKIEVDSDGDARSAGVNEKSSNKSKASQKELKRKSTDMATTSKTKKNSLDAATTSSASKRQSNGSMDKHKENDDSTNIKPTKKIKLKRNFRTNKENNEKEERSEPVKNFSEKTSKEIKEEKYSRSPSPDVIPIVAEPETLLISDSASEDEKASVTTSTTINLNIGKAIDLEQQTAQDEISKSAAHSRERKITEPEDGEISEDAMTPTNDKDKEIFEQRSDNNSIDNTKNDNSDNTTNPTNCSGEEKNVEHVADDDNKCETLDNVDSNTVEAQEEKELNASPAEKVMSEELNKSNESELNEKQSTSIGIEQKPMEEADDEYDDQNDDVISIEGGDLETEMIEHLEENSDTKMSSFKEKDSKTVKSKPEQIEEDIISLDSSEDELAKREDLESWNTRWLKSSKVSKVLLASRLGKRVRDKIKKSKHSKKNIMREKQEDEEENETNKTSSSYSSKHEDGSIEQYKELLEIRQRKT